MLSKLRQVWTALQLLFGYLVADPLYVAVVEGWSAARRTLFWAFVLITPPGLLVFWLLGVAPLDYITGGRFTDAIDRSETYRLSYSCMETRALSTRVEGMTISTPFTARFRYASSEGFRNGHLCSKYTRVSTPNSSCLSSTAQVIERTPAAAVPACREWKLETEE